MTNIRIVSDSQFNGLKAGDLCKIEGFVMAPVRKHPNSMAQDERPHAVISRYSDGQLFTVQLHTIRAENDILESPDIRAEMILKKVIQDTQENANTSGERCYLLRGPDSNYYIIDEEDIGIKAYSKMDTLYIADPQL